jgi:hypothetical protein
MRSAFSIARSPLNDPRPLPSQAGLRILQTARLSQAAVHKPHSESRASLEVSYFAMAWMS